MANIKAAVAGLLLLIICSPPAKGGDLFRYVGLRKPIPADAGWERIIGSNGKPVIERRDRGAEKKNKKRELLSRIERLTLKGHQYYQNKHFRDATSCFQEALAAFTDLSYQSPEQAETHLIDHAETLESYAETLLKLNSRGRAKEYLAASASIRARLSTKKSVARTYSNGYLEGGRIRP